MIYQPITMLLLLLLTSALLILPSHQQDLAKLLQRREPQEHCPQECSCIFRENRKVTECIGKGLVAVPFGIPPNSMTVDLSDNAFTQMAADGYFKERRLQDIRNLILHGSRIAELGSHVFAGMNLLEKLDLSDNHLRSLPKSVFEDLRGLKELSLAKNKFSTTQDKTFEGATGLEYIDFSHNSLTRLAVRTFALLPRLKSIDLSNNQLQRLSKDVFEGIPTLHLIHLYNNPWNCDCELRETVRLVKQRRLSEAGTCHFPARLRGKTWDQLNDADFACPPEIRQYEIRRKQSVQSGGTLILLCPVVADPKPHIIWQFHSTDTMAVGQRFDKSVKVTLADTSQSQDPITEDKRFTIYSEPVFQSPNEWRFYLNVTDFKESDAGHYMCVASNPADKVMEVFDIDFKPDIENAQASVGGHSLVRITWDMVLIIIVLIGSILIVFFVCLIILCYRKSESGSLTVEEKQARMQAAVAIQPGNAIGNGYVYQVVADGSGKSDSAYGFVTRLSNQEPKRENNTLASANLYHQLPNARNSSAQPAALTPIDHSYTVQRQLPNGKSVQFVANESTNGEKASPANSGSWTMAQDDSGYLDSDSPRLLCPLHQAFSSHSHHHDTAHPQHASHTSPLTSARNRAPLARVEADNNSDPDARMPLKETAL